MLCQNSGNSYLSMCDQPGIVLQTIQWKGTRELVIMQHILFTYSVQEHNFTDIMNYTEEIQYYQDLLQHNYCLSCM